MEKIIKSGKTLESTLEEILYENKLSKDDIIYSYTESKKGLFKSASVEITAYNKKDIYESAKEFLKEVGKGLGLDITFELRVKDERPVIIMYSDNNNILIGRNGNTLKSLETLLKQKIQTETNCYFAISLDVENYKDKKNSRLERLAKQTAREVMKTKVSVALENMNAYERRIVHNALTTFKHIDSQSEGEEPNRHIVIKYKD